MCYNIAIKVGQRVATVEYAPYHILTTFIFMLIGEANIMKRKTHEEYVFEVSQINPFIEVIGKYAGNHIKILHKCKIDGYEWMVAPSNILHGTGCPKCKALKLHTLKIKTNDQYVTEVAKINPNIVVVGKYSGNKVPILHKCLLDGNEWYSAPGHILEGSGCPKCFAIRNSINRTKTHEQYVDEVSKINHNIIVVGKYVDVGTKILHRCLIDGCEWFSLPSNILSYHGCPVCNSSIGEKLISKYLNDNQINYTPQYKFSDCKHIKPLPFDFYLQDYNVCIEYDGIQHFESVERFGGEEGFRKTRERDEIKTQYCKNNNIPLLRIRYDQDIVGALYEFLLQYNVISREAAS